MLFRSILPCIVCSNIFASWAYLYPENFKEHFSQNELIVYWFTSNLIILGLYLILCVQAKINVTSLWLSLPCIVLGGFLIAYSYKKMGIKRTFFGVELGVIEDDVKIESFPFNLGHVQYKGFIILLLGLWLSCKHSHELTIVTGFWILSFMVQMYIEC